MIRINPLFFVLIFVVWISDLLPQFLTVFVIAVLHESAHALCSYALGNKAIKFSIQPWGVCMTCEEFKNSKQEFLTASAGPVLNLLLMFVGAMIESHSFFVANLFMLVINLLPVYPLDGGRILFSFLKNEVSLLTLKYILKMASVLTTVILCIVGCILIYKTGVNFSVLIAAIFLSLTTDRVDFKIPEDVIKKSFHYTVVSDQKVVGAIKYHKKNASVIFDVVDVSEHYVGSVTYKEMLEKIAYYGYEIKFGEILEKQLLY